MLSSCTLPAKGGLARMTSNRWPGYAPPKPVVNDPPGLAVQGGLHQLGYTGVAITRDLTASARVNGRLIW